MVLRIVPRTKRVETQEAWPALEATQQTSQAFAGCVSQPAHAALSGQIAATLQPSLFGELPPEVLDAIGRHDAGWAGPDLAALECSPGKAPVSFLDYPPTLAVVAWRNSIRAAEERSPLAGILTSRHFCLLDPHDGDVDHERFRTEETARREPLERLSGMAAADLDRYTAALGFCDLLSLCLASGLQGSIRMPVAHPADPASKAARQVTLTLEGDRVGSDDADLRPGATLHTTAWMWGDGRGIVATALTWAVA